MVTIRISDKKIEKEFSEILKNRYNGNVDKAIKDFIELLEDFEDAVDVELRKNEKTELWENVKNELNL
ncbi:MAG TPA: hypothetical protein ENH82_01985 [bacterium]|nr:hypothetical protein [bacterium]